MGIPGTRQKERERRRRQIVVAAKRVFSKKGFNRARMEDIAGAAELAPATLYIYFKNKEELFASFSLVLMQALCDELKGISEDTGATPEDKLAKLRDVLFELYSRDPWGMGSMLQVQSGEILNNLSARFIGVLKEMLKKSNRMLKMIFQEGISKGVFVNKHPMAMVNIFWSTLSGVLLLEKNRIALQGDEGGFRRSFDFAFDIIQRGLTRSYLTKEVRDKVCCQCALKQDCSGLRELFMTPMHGCPEPAAMSGVDPMVGLIKPARVSATPTGCYV